jgi:hypothetical protein
VRTHQNVIRSMERFFWTGRLIEKTIDLLLEQPSRYRTGLYKYEPIFWFMTRCRGGEAEVGRSPQGQTRDQPSGRLGSTTTFSFFNVAFGSVSRGDKRSSCTWSSATSHSLTRKCPVVASRQRVFVELVGIVGCSSHHRHVGGSSGALQLIFLTS